MREEIFEGLNTIQFYGAFTTQAPIDIDELAMRYKELVPSIHRQEMDDLKVEIYVALLPQMKIELGRMGMTHTDHDDLLGLAYDVVDYLLNKWEVKYYSQAELKKKGLSGAKRNSFFGYFFTYFKSNLLQKWNYAKDYNGNLIKKSKTVDLNIKKEQKRIDSRMNISRVNKVKIKEEIREKATLVQETYYDDFGSEREFVGFGIDETKVALMEYLRRNYSYNEMVCIFYIAKIELKTFKEFQEKMEMDKVECEEWLERTRFIVERDKELYNILIGVWE